MKYIVLSLMAVILAVSTVAAQPRPKTMKAKKQIGKHPNGKGPAPAVLFPKKNLATPSS
jgi:hypothetical protein